MRPAPTGGERCDKLRALLQPEWRNWQTHGTQNPAFFGTCGFDPHLRHHPLHQRLLSFPRPAAVLALTLLLSTRSASAEDAKFLPFIGPQLEAARYSSANEEFAWVGWIGARTDLVDVGKSTAFFNPNVETILGHRVRSFEAVQANYSLEVGLRRAIGRRQASLFFHHVSRHEQDRLKVQAVDWNFLGLRLESPWPARWNRGGGFAASFGAATLSSGVNYDWEARMTADIDIVRKGEKSLFFLADGRRVGAVPSTGYSRGSFTDFRGELGFRFARESRRFSLFVAYDHRNDARIQGPLVIDRALFGFRIRGERRDIPSSVPLP